MSKIDKAIEKASSSFNEIARLIGYYGTEDDILDEVIEGMEALESISDDTRVEEALKFINRLDCYYSSTDMDTMNNDLLRELTLIKAILEQPNKTKCTK